MKKWLIIPVLFFFFIVHNGSQIMAQSCPMAKSMRAGMVTEIKKRIDYQLEMTKHIIHWLKYSKHKNDDMLRSMMLSALKHHRQLLINDIEQFGKVQELSKRMIEVRKLVEEIQLEAKMVYKSNFWPLPVYPEKMSML